MVHHGSLATIVVEKNHELPENDPTRKFKGRTVFLGDQVRDHNGDSAVFEELQSAPAAMEAGRICDMYGCVEGNCITTSDGVQAYVQAELKGTQDLGGDPSATLAHHLVPPGRYSQISASRGASDKGTIQASKRRVFLGGRM